MDLIVSTPQGEAEISVNAVHESVTVGDLLGRVLNSAPPGLVHIDGRPTPVGTLLSAAGLVTGTVIDITATHRAVAGGRDHVGAGCRRRWWQPSIAGAGSLLTGNRPASQRRTADVQPGPGPALRARRRTQRYRHRHRQPGRPRRSTGDLPVAVGAAAAPHRPSRLQARLDDPRPGRIVDPNAVGAAQLHARTARRGGGRTRAERWQLATATGACAACAPEPSSRKSWRPRSIRRDLPSRPSSTPSAGPTSTWPKSCAGRRSCPSACGSADRPMTMPSSSASASPINHGTSRAAGRAIAVNCCRRCRYWWISSTNAVSVSPAHRPRHGLRHGRW